MENLFSLAEVKFGYRYFFFVLAFALGFYIMLHRDTTDAGVEDDVKNATDYYPFFDDPFLSMVKTTTMFVGEIEFSDIPIEGPMLPLRYFVVLIFELLVIAFLLISFKGSKYESRIEIVLTTIPVVSQHSDG
jgi:hypothetical protein